MTVTNGYAKLSHLKQRLSIPDADDDEQLERVIEGVSRALDAITRRRFFTNSTAEKRYYTARRSAWLIVDDLQSIATSGLKTDSDGDRTYEETWATTDYDLLPFNAALDGEPYTRLEVTPSTGKRFPLTRRGVEINGTFGYSSLANLPFEVNEACLLLSEKLWQRKNSPHGILGAAQLGQITLVARALGKNDPDIMMLLQGLMRVRIAV